MNSSNAGTPIDDPTGFWRKLSLSLSMVKISHSVFALPFALISMLYASAGRPRPSQIIMIVLAMVTARNVAMTFNRIVDARIDALNPRTAGREIPAGLLTTRFAISFLIINAMLFIGVSAMFNELTLILSPAALLIIMFYSLAKRFTDFTQLFLGLSLGCAPIAAWIAITGRTDIFPLLLGLGVLFWVAGFDLIYSTQDFDFDRKHGVGNLVARLGIRKGLILARLLHLMSVIVFLVAAGFPPFPGFYFKLGIILMGLVLLGEHLLVSADNLQRVNQAFFTFNGFTALMLLAFTLLDLF